MYVNVFAWNIFGSVGYENHLFPLKALTNIF